MARLFCAITSLSYCFKRIYIGVSALLMAMVSHAENITFYTYHQKPPYYFQQREQGPGIYQSLVNYLNSRQTEVQVTLEFRPRKRLELDLNSGRLKGAVVGVSPIWFKDKSETRYLWSAPFMQDRDVIVVRKGQEFPYAHPRDLEGRTLTMPRGHYYWGVTERIKEEKIKVFYTDSDIQDLSMVAYNRADATIISLPTARYLGKKEFEKDWFSILETPHDQYTRRILFPKYYKYEFKKLNSLLRNIQDDPEWLNELKKWGYDAQIKK